LPGFANRPHFITFDMGAPRRCRLVRDVFAGTELRQLIGGLPVRLPSVDTARSARRRLDRWFAQDDRMKVGPMSAGAYPGPACYGSARQAARTHLSVDVFTAALLSAATVQARSRDASLVAAEPIARGPGYAPALNWPDLHPIILIEPGDSSRAAPIVLDVTDGSRTGNPPISLS